MMSDTVNHSPETPAPDVAQAPEEPSEGVQEGSSDGEAADPRLAAVRREAAGYRTRLRDTEAERDRLSGALEALRRADVERAVTGTDGLADAADLWRAGVELGELLGEDGTVDAERVRAARDRVLADHPHWKHSAATGFDGGARGGGVADAGPSFGESLKRAVGDHR